MILFFLAPAIAELLSGSAPPAEFFNPISLLLLASLYGSGALVIREMKVRLSKGYVSMLVLGMVYGIVEEGLMVKSFFDPEWGDLGILGIYGRWQGVNWVWVEWLTIYHAIFSIAIPITIVELAYPERRNESWVGNKKFMGLVVLMGAVTVFGYLFLTDYRPPFPQYFLSAAIATLLILVAWRIPVNTGRNGILQALMPKKLLLIGFLTTLTLFMLFMAGPHLINQPPILMILGAGLLFAIFCFLKRYEWDEETLYHKFTLASSAVVFLAALTPLQELDKSRLDNTRGMLIVGIIALVLLILLRLRLKSQMFAREQELEEATIKGRRARKMKQ